MTFRAFSQRAFLARFPPFFHQRMRVQIPDTSRDIILALDVFEAFLGDPRSPF
jgi:hypothetical protein